MIYELPSNCVRLNFRTMSASILHYLFVCDRCCRHGFLSAMFVYSAWLTLSGFIARRGGCDASARVVAVVQYSIGASKIECGIIYL